MAPPAESHLARAPSTDLEQPLQQSASLQSPQQNEQSRRNLHKTSLLPSRGQKAWMTNSDNNAIQFIPAENGNGGSNGVGSHGKADGKTDGKKKKGSKEGDSKGTEKKKSANTDTNTVRADSKRVKKSVPKRDNAKGEAELSVKKAIQRERDLGKGDSKNDKENVYIELDDDEILQPVRNKIAKEINTKMSGNFERQQASFLSSMSAAASKLGSGAGTKRSLAPPSPSPSVGSTTSVAAAGSLTPRRDRVDTPGNIVYSQPALTGTGDSIISQMAYAVSWLRGKDEPQSCADVLGYLSATARPEKEQEYFVEQMRRHPQIQWIPDPALSEQTWRSGTYAHRPTIPNVKTKTQLLAYLQKKTDASGVSVKDLKDGWPDCEAAINELEKEHRVLVIRAKKDGAARMVWLDDPSLFHEVDPELKVMWARVEVPAVENIVARLVAAQQKPASEDPMLKASQAPKAVKKKKAQRRTGKSTNVHMQGLLKDYSHTKR